LGQSDLVIYFDLPVETDAIPGRRTTKTTHIATKKTRFLSTLKNDKKCCIKSNWQLLLDGSGYNVFPLGVETQITELELY
jgi:hypothetical protein